MVAQNSKRKVRKLSLVMTEACNLKCKYCYARLSNRWSRLATMKEESAREIAYQFLSNCTQCDFIQFFGGEPSLNISGIEAVIQLALNMAEEGLLVRKPRFGIVTNGVFVNRAKTMDLLKKHEIEVTVSLDGPASIHDALRVKANGEPTFKDAFQTLNDAKEANLRVAIETVYTSLHIDNAYSIVDAFKFCLSSGIKKLIFQLSYPPAPDYLNPLIGHYFDQLLAYYMEAVDWWFNGLLDDDSPVLDVYFKELLMSMLHGCPAVSVIGCPAGVYDFSIGPSGTVYPCQLLYGNEEVKLGNILSDQNLSIKRNFPVCADDIPECKECFARYWCQPCAALNAFWGNSWVPPHPECELRRAVILRLADWAFSKLAMPECETTRLLHQAVQNSDYRKCEAKALSFDDSRQEGRSTKTSARV